jgi:hypothetical protein
MKLTSKAPGSKLLKLKCDGPLLIFAFNFNLRRYMVAREMASKRRKTVTGAAVPVLHNAGAGAGSTRLSGRASQIMPLPHPHPVTPDCLLIVHRCAHCRRAPGLSRAAAGAAATAAAAAVAASCSFDNLAY